MPLAARLTDLHICPLCSGPPHVGGPVMLGDLTVLIGGLPAARVGDECLCVGLPDFITLGSTTVMIGGLPAARLGDLTEHEGMIVLGDLTVTIGG